MNHQPLWISEFKTKTHLKRSSIHANPLIQLKTMRILNKNCRRKFIIRNDFSQSQGKNKNNHKKPRAFLLASRNQTAATRQRESKDMYQERLLDEKKQTAAAAATTAAAAAAAAWQRGSEEVRQARLLAYRYQTTAAGQGKNEHATRTIASGQELSRCYPTWWKWVCNKHGCLRVGNKLRLKATWNSNMR